MRMPLAALAAILFAGPALAQEALRVETLATGFNASGDLSVSKDGDIYIGHFGASLPNSTGQEVLRFTPDGQESVFANGFSGASGNTFGPDGAFYQSNIQLGQVVRVDAEGNKEVYASGMQGALIGLAFDSHGNLFANSCDINTIYRINPQRQVTTFASGFPLSCPNGLTADENDNLYAVNFNNGQVIKIAPSAEMSILANTPAGSFRPTGGNGHVTYGNGVLYVASNASSRIFRVSLDGQMSVLAGSGQRGHVDGAPGEASFQMPNGIDLSPDGTRLYVNESETTTGGNLSGSYPLTPNRLRVVVLEETQAPFVLNAALSGGWFEPATSGQGFVLEVIPEINTIIAGWFTFARENEAGNRWFSLEGEYVGNAGMLTIYQSTGGAFDDPAAVDTVAVGSAVLTFSNCTTAELVYQFDDGLTGTIPLQRLVGAELCQSLSTVGEGIPDQFPAHQSAAFINVNLVSMVDDLVQPGHVVVVRDGVIQAIGPVGQVPVPPDAIAIDASGMYLGPGMTEMHQHQSYGGPAAGRESGTLLIAAGVTTVLSMGNSVAFDVPALGAQFASGSVIGPTVYAGNIAYGAPGNGDRTIETPGQASQYAQRLADEGYDYIKEYWFLTPDVLAQFEIESQRLDLPIIGHIPRTRPMSESLSKGHRMAAHIQEPFVTFMQSQMNPSLINTAAQIFLDNGTWLTPTLAVFDSYVRISGGNQAEYNALLDAEGAEYTPQSVKFEWSKIYNLDFVQAGQPGDLDPLYDLFELMTRRFFDAGVPLLLGTDAPSYPGLVSGFAIYKEMELLQQAGIDPADIYRIATRNAGRFIDETLDPEIGFGTVEVGKRADLILTESNPLDSIANVRRPVGVMANGRFWSRGYLDERLTTLAQTAHLKLADESVATSQACTDHFAELRFAGAK